jgi:hypothetical protein
MLAGLTPIAAAAMPVPLNSTVCGVERVMSPTLRHRVTIN